MTPAWWAALLVVAAQAPDEFVAIRCVGTEKYMPTGARTETVQAATLTLILNEHDRSVSRWNESLGREEPLCGSEIKGCVVDFGPALITVDSDLKAPASLTATIDRRAGTYHSFVTLPEAHTSTTAQCTKIAVPTFDPATRMF